jgi:hypothetical protein
MEMVELLIQNGVKLHNLSPDSWMAASLASENGHEDVADYILDMGRPHNRGELIYK